MSRKPDMTGLRSPDGGWIGPEELQAILADEGYSAGDRQQFLKAVLTELTRVDPEEAEQSENCRRLLEEVRNNLSHEQEKTDQKPLSDDTL